MEMDTNHIVISNIGCNSHETELEKLNIELQDVQLKILLMMLPRFY